jgi:hypothetical protein
VLHILFLAINIHYFKIVFNGLDALICDFFTNVALRTEHSKNLPCEFYIPGDDPFEALCVLLPYNKTGETPLFPAILPIERQTLLFRLLKIFKI